MEIKKPQMAKSRNTSISKSVSIKQVKPIQPLSMKLLVEMKKQENSDKSILVQITNLKKEKTELLQLLTAGEQLMDQKKKKYAQERESIQKIFEEISSITDKCITSSQKIQIIEFLRSIQKSTTTAWNSQEIQCNLMKCDEDDASTLCTNRDWIQSEISKYKAQIDTNNDMLKRKKEKFMQLNDKILRLNNELSVYKKMYRNDSGPNKSMIPSFFYSLK